MNEGATMAYAHSTGKERRGSVPPGTTCNALEPALVQSRKGKEDHHARQKERSVSSKSVDPALLPWIPLQCQLLRPLHCQNMPAPSLPRSSEASIASARFLSPPMSPRLPLSGLLCWPAGPCRRTDRGTRPTHLNISSRAAAFGGAVFRMSFSCCAVSVNDMMLPPVAGSNWIGLDLNAPRKLAASPL